MAAIIAAFIAANHGGSSGALGSVEYAETGSRLAGLAVKVGFLLFSVAAALVWATRRKAALWAAALLALAAAPLVFVGTVNRYPANANSMSVAQFRAVGLGASKSEITDRFGSPFAEGRQTFPSRSTDCVLYEGIGRFGKQRYPTVFAFCFSDDRLVARHRG